MRRNLVAGSYGLWLFATEVLFYFYYTGSDSSDQVTLEISVLLGLIPAAVQLLLLGFNPLGAVASVRWALTFLLIVLASFLASVFWSGNEYTAGLVWVASLVFIFFISILVAGSPDERLIRSIAVFYSVPAALFLLYVTATGEYVWGRLQAHGITADWWGFMGAGLAMAALAHRSRWLTALCIGAGFCVAYAASARSGMVAILAGLLAVGFLELRLLRGSRLVTVLAISLAGLVLLTLFSSTVTDAVTKAIVQTMLLNDPGRGLDSGLTGRTEIWGQAIQIWLSSPVLGVGFHQSSTLISGNYSAHNVYLAALDTGILGLAWYLAFLCASLLASLSINERHTRNAAVGTIVGYIVMGFFDARGLNSGNPFSLYFEMCAFFALRHASLQRLVLDAPEPSLEKPITLGWASVLKGRLGLAAK